MLFRSHHLLELLRVRSRLIDEIVAQAGPYFAETISFDPEAVAKQWKDPVATLALMTAMREALEAHAGWDPVELEEAMRTLAEAKGVGAGKLLQPLRIALVGVAASPGIFDVMLVLGRERTIARIARAEATLREMAPSA